MGGAGGWEAPVKAVAAALAWSAELVEVRPPKGAVAAAADVGAGAGFGAAADVGATLLCAAAVGDAASVRCTHERIQNSTGAYSYMLL